MLSDLACGCEVYLVTGYTDMRKGINGLATIVQGKLCWIRSARAFICSAEETAVR